MAHARARRKTLGILAECSAVPPPSLHVHSLTHLLPLRSA